MASLWSQLIRKEGYKKIDEQSKARLLSNPRGWVDVIDDIVRILPPGSKLRVWRYEDFSKIEPEIVSLLVGGSNASNVEATDHKFLPSITKRAMKRLEELDGSGMPTGPEDVKRVANRFSKKKGFNAYSPWTDEEKEILSKRYVEDIAHIEGRWPSIMICEQ